MFISHSHEDKEIAMKIKAELEEHGLRSFVAHEDIEPSKEWAKEIVKVARSCRIFIYLLSENFYNSGSRWPDHEIGMGVFGNSLCIPLSMDDKIPYGALAHIQKAKIDEEGYYKRKLVVLSGKTSIELPQFIFSKWYQEEKEEALSYLISALKDVKDFHTGNRICVLLADIDNKNQLTYKEASAIISSGLSNEQVFNPKYSTSSRTFIEALTEKHSQSLDKELVRKVRGNALKTEDGALPNPNSQDN